MFIAQVAKKLASILATSMSKTIANLKAKLVAALRPGTSVPDTNDFTLPLERVSYICHLVQFKKDQAETQILINSDNEVNAITLAYAKKLGL